VSVGILIPTFERYRSLSEFTRGKIAEFWKNHPKIFLSGISADDEPGWVPGIVPGGSWTGNLLHSVNFLIEEQIDSIYLILDDHPPVRRCNDQYLNENLPWLMHELDATYIGLMGWGQGQGSSGTKLGEMFHGMECVGEDLKYKFSLHPGLWHARRLKEILTVMLKRFPDDPTPWKFEKTSVSLQELESHYKDKCFRIDGIETSPRPVFCRTVKRQRILTKKYQDQLDTFGGAIRAYYEGPYPMIWSGVMHQGKRNPAFFRYLKLFGKWRYLSSLNQCMNTIFNQKS